MPSEHPDQEMEGPSADQQGDAVSLLEAERIAEALVFASAEPVSEAFLAERLPQGAPVATVMQGLAERYVARGVNLVRSGDRWAFRTAPGLSFVIRKDDNEVRKLSRAALEVLALIAYHQITARKTFPLQVVWIFGPLIALEIARIWKTRATPSAKL